MCFDECLDLPLDSVTEGKHVEEARVCLYIKLGPGSKDTLPQEPYLAQEASPNQLGKRV